MIGSRGEYGRPKRLRPNGISRAVVYFGIHRDDDDVGRTDGKSIDRASYC